MNKGKILIGSPIYQKPIILELFLHCLSRLQLADYEVHYHFIDDNRDAQSRHILHTFQQNNRNVLIESAREEAEDPYHGHNWSQKKIWKVAGFKNRIIEHARCEVFDYLFLVDSDLLLYPQTISCLIDARKEIVSEVFWTKWVETSVQQPQVWLTDDYIQYKKEVGEKVSKEEERVRTFAFFDMLKKPGVYEVGGLGACTLIARSALEKGVSFKQIKNLSFWGEDRHFCVRASALGIDLFVDTHYPAFHIFRDLELKGGFEFLSNLLNI